jgi:hypothetical protein
MQTSARRPGLIAIATVALLAAIVGGGGVAFASHDFDDVSDANVFHDQISAIATAGITTGFDDGGYHPSATVSRQAMAAFMARGFGRSGFDDGTVPSAADNTENNVAQVTITSGAAAGTGGYVVLTGTIGGSFIASDCPCSVRSELLDVTPNDDQAASLSSIGNNPTFITATFGSTTSTYRFAIPANTTRTYRLNGSSFTTGASTGSLSGELTAVYVPFDQTGNGA